ncbi:MAG: 50S ribosomal protein L4 [Syntrophomonadaceae bacterium]|nr:50S ribosomal protein L4 [Syntrophomonadaceae bacterium]
MPTVPLYNMTGAQIGEIELDDRVFGIEPNQAAMHAAVKMQLANQRAGTSSTKTRSEVRGGGRKPFRQKGTGRARAGSIRSPLWRKGGVIFGPQPREYSYKLPRKLRRLALKSALSSKAKSEGVLVVDELVFEEPKTRRMIEVLDSLDLYSKTLVVTADGDVNVIKSARNIPGVKPVRADFLSVYDILDHDKLVITQEAVARVEEVLAR